MLGAERLGQIIVGAKAHRLDRVGNRAVRGHHHDLHRGVLLLDRLQQLESTQARHPHVADHDLGFRFRGEHFERALGAFGLGHAMARALEARGEHPAYIAVVINDHDPGQALPRLAVQVPFYCSTGQRHQEPAARCSLQVARPESSKPLRFAFQTLRTAIRSCAIIAVCILHFESHASPLFSAFARGDSYLAATPKFLGTERVQPQATFGKQTRAIVVTTGMLAFISFWRASAIVLCDLASTAYYIGGIVDRRSASRRPISSWG